LENQHRHITGYRELTDAEVALMNEAKELAERCGAFIKKLGKASYPTNCGDGSHIYTCADQRWVNIGQTHLQQGFMALTRSVAKPTTF